MVGDFAGGISLLSCSLLSYRTVLSSCDDMNIYLIPLYQPDRGTFKLDQLVTLSFRKSTTGDLLSKQCTASVGK